MYVCIHIFMARLPPEEVGPGVENVYIEIYDINIYIYIYKQINVSIYYNYLFIIYVFVCLSIHVFTHLFADYFYRPYSMT